MVEVYLSHDRRECDKFTNSQAMMCHRCESGAIALSHVIQIQTTVYGEKSAEWEIQRGEYTDRMINGVFAGLGETKQ